MKTRTLGAAALTALCLSGCGGAKQSAPPPPKLPRALASQLASTSDAVADSLATGDSCRALTLAQQLQTQTIAAINAGRVPNALQEQLSGSVNALVARVRCVAPAVPAPAPKEHGKGHEKKKHKGDD
jgi:outer membrane murein-binding lipoprotein Lpp